jgi:hypothetical protein
VPPFVDDSRKAAGAGSVCGLSLVPVGPGRRRGRQRYLLGTASKPLVSLI